MNRDIVDEIAIATPCPAAWENMEGDERVRYCGQCKLNVYNVAELSRSETKALLRSNSDSVCLRIYKRQDGTVITKDCPVGISILRDQINRRARKLRQRLWAVAAVILAMFAANKSERANAQSPNKDAFAAAEHPADKPTVSVTAVSVTAAPVAPQGTQPTAVPMMGTAGTVRVNNQANLEALLSMVSGFLQLVLAVFGSIYLAFGVFARNAKKRNTLVGLALLVSAAGIPVVFDALTSALREANYFQ